MTYPDDFQPVAPDDYGIEIEKHITTVSEALREADLRLMGAITVYGVTREDGHLLPKAAIVGSPMICNILMLATFIHATSKYEIPERDTLVDLQRRLLQEYVDARAELARRQEDERR